MNKKYKNFIFILLIVAFWYQFIHNKSKNHEKAYYEKYDNYYRVKLTGVRYLMTHDPVSALLRKTYIEEEYLTLPKITGVVQGKVIPVEFGGSYQYEGNITFAKKSMKIELYYPEYQEQVPPYRSSPKSPLRWNGKYTLERSSN
jgi:hypothetical protein